MNLLRSAVVLCLFTAAPLLAQTPTAADIAAADAKVAEAARAIERGEVEAGLRQYGEAVRMVRSGDAAHRLGHLYEGQTAVPGNAAEALKWFQYAAELRHPDAMHHVGRHYLDGTGGLARNFNEGYSLMQAASEGGYRPATEVIVEMDRAKNAAENCLVQALSDAGMERSAFGGVRYYRVTEGAGANISGDTFALGRYGARARLTVDGFAPSSSDNGIPGIALGAYSSRPPSPAAQRLAAELRRQCDAE